MLRKIPVKSGDEAPSAPPVPREVLAGTPAMKPKTAIAVRDESSAHTVSTKLPNASALNFKPLTTIRPSMQPPSPEIKGPETIDEPEDMAGGDGSDTNVPEIKDLPADEPPKPPRRNIAARFFGGYWRKKLWTFPLTLLVALGIIAALPASRYPILALFMTRSFSITVVDSTTNKPVTGASVSLDGQSTETGSTGMAYITAKVGHGTVTVSKKYYQDAAQAVFVGISVRHNAATVQLVATGRQVPITVTDKITGKALPNAAIRVADTEARSDAKGEATIVLPTDQPTQATTISADGYTTLTTNIHVTSDVVKENSFALVPTGRIYFLSNLSGKIDVVSTNLDGTGRKTVLAGTGSEDASSTVLLASRDWQFLALLSKRDGGQYAKLFIINTASGTARAIDSSHAAFTLVGWSDHTFVYELNNADKELWQSGKTALVSYDADGSKSVPIAQTTAQGDSSSYTEQDLGFVNLVNNRIVYGFAWNTPETGPPLGTNMNSIYSASVDGNNKKDLRDVTPPSGTTYSGLYAVLVNPGELYIQSSMESQPSVYYAYKYQNDSVTQSDTITDNSFSNAQQNAATYLLSPTGQSTFWSQTRDGKNTLFIGDNAGLNGDQIASLSDFAPYGWYTDKYVLVQKGGSELYIMPVGGGTPLKISDYYKPQYTFSGYGGGYGGL